MEPFVEGVGIGISSGLVLSAILALIQWLQSRIERRNQVQVLAGVIRDFRNQIYDAKSVDVTLEQSPKTFTKDALQHAYYGDMQRQVSQILAGRSSRLSFDEIGEVRSAFFTVLYPGVILNEAGYDSVFGKFESIRWLNLEPRR